MGKSVQELFQELLQYAGEFKENKNNAVASDLKQRYIMKLSEIQALVDIRHHYQMRNKLHDFENEVLRGQKEQVEELLVQLQWLHRSFETNVACMSEIEQILRNIFQTLDVRVL